MTTKNAWNWRSLLGARAALAYGLTAVVVAGLLFLLHRAPQVSFASVASAMRQFPVATLVFVFVLWSLQNLAASVRLHVLLEDEARGSLLDTWQAISVGQCFNAFLPARVGDAMKLYLVNRKRPGHGFSIAGTLVADRIADLSALAIVIVAAGAYRAAPFSLPKPSAAVVGSVVGGLALLVFVGVRVLSPARRARVRKAVSDLAQGLRGLKRPGPLAAAVLVSAFAWICESSALIVLVRSQGFPFSPAEGVYLLFLLNAATAVPVSVGQVGTFEASIVYALGTLNVPTTPALAVAITHHLLYFGMLCAWALGTTALVRLRDKRVEARAVTAP